LEVFFKRADMTPKYQHWESTNKRMPFANAIEPIAQLEGVIDVLDDFSFRGRRLDGSSRLELPLFDDNGKEEEGFIN
jgi:hypothetical protein